MAAGLCAAPMYMYRSLQVWSGLT